MKPLPIIGFDRYVPRHWLDAALAVAAGDIERSTVVSLLGHEIAGVEARSKTMIILNRIWLTPNSTLVDFASVGVAVYRASNSADTMPLHWGMALASHPFFAAVADNIGRLLKLQGEFTALQINRRLKEQLGDRASILRATEAVLQTMTEWGVICEAQERKRAFVAGRLIAVKSQPVSIWLLESCLRASGRSLSLNEPLNFLFPFGVTPIRAAEFTRQDRLRVTALASGQTTVAIST